MRRYVRSRTIGTDAAGNVMPQAPQGESSKHVATVADAS